MITIALYILGVLALWVVGCYIWAQYKLRPVRKMYSEITHEEVHKRAQRYKLNWIYNPTSDPPLIRAFNEIKAEKKKNL